tara:strand:+ start:169 stop:606 length:438 start_codon:yes stop_codon:yes gene_type:complete
MTINNSGKVNIPGHTIQTVSNFITTDFNTASTSFVTTGLSQAITPSSTSSKILCIVSMGGWYISSGGSSSATVYRGSTNIGNGNAGIMGVETPALRIPSTGQVLDSPNTTSATTYTVYALTSGHTTYISYSSYGHFTLTLMEIAQ